ncbi:hypothetical protein M569_05094, partial [Genlisea aurea]
MKVTLTSFRCIRPAEPTWNGIMPLSESDQTGVITHVPTIYFYRPGSDVDIPLILTASLSRALVYFYPLAGRLRRLPRGRLELDCNGEGVSFVEAECGNDMDELGEFGASSPEFESLIPKVDYCSGDVVEFPLLLVQVTKFRCGGACLSLAISHAVVDGQSSLHFISEWARLARGELIQHLPILDRKLLRAGEKSSATQSAFRHKQFDPPPLIVGEIDAENERKKPTAVAMLRISRSQVRTLKLAANDGRRDFTRYEALTAHVWRSACRARALRDEQPTNLAICVEIRRRVSPNLPAKFFGNAIVDVIASSSSGELTGNPLGFAAGKVKEAIESVTGEYVDSVIDYLKNLEDLAAVQDVGGRRREKKEEGPFYGNPNIGVISWMGLPLYGLDFGWGKEIYMGPGTHDSDGDSLILPAPDSDGDLVVAICLQVECMDAFKNFFYQDI